MAVFSWTLLDVDRRDYIAEKIIGPADVRTAHRFSIHKRRLQGGLCDGVDLIEVDNGRCRLIVLPTRGMGIWKAELGEVRLGWQAPLKGPVHPAFVPLWEPSGLGWLSGFDEFLCRCGLESNGAPVFDERGKLLYPLHGKIANLPAHHVDVSIDTDSQEITVSGVVDESRLYHNKLRLKSSVRTRFGESGFRITDEVTNLSGEPGELELLYHVNFGPPLVEAGARLVAPVKTLVPRNPRAAEGVSTWDTYGPEQPGFTEQVYFMELAADSAGHTQVLLKNAHGFQGASLKFNLQQLPTFTLWKSTQAAADGYVTGLEPGVNFPNPRPFEKQQGRVVTLAPHAREKFELAVEVHFTAEAVAQVEAAIAKLKPAEVKIYTAPQPAWAP